MYTFKLIWVNKYHPEVNLTSMVIKDNGNVELDISLSRIAFMPPHVSRLI